MQRVQRSIHTMPFLFQGVCACACVWIRRSEIALAKAPLNRWES